MAASLVMYYEDIRNDSTRKDANPVIKIMNFEATQCGIDLETLRSCGLLIREHFKASNERNAIEAGVTDAEHLQLQMQYLSSHISDLKEAAQFGFRQAIQEIAAVNRTNERQTEEIMTLRAELGHMRRENTHYLQRIMMSVENLSLSFGVLSVTGSTVAASGLDSPSRTPASPLNMYHSPALVGPAPSAVAEVEAAVTGDGEGASSPIARVRPPTREKHNFALCLGWTVSELLYNVAVDNVHFSNNSFPYGLCREKKSDSQVKNKAKVVVLLAHSTASKSEMNELGKLQLWVQLATDAAAYNDARFEIKRIALDLHQRLYDVIYGYCLASVWGPKRVFDESRKDKNLTTAGKMYNTYERQLPKPNKPSGLRLTESGIVLFPIDME